MAPIDLGEVWESESVFGCAKTSFMLSLALWFCLGTLFGFFVGSIFFFFLVINSFGVKDGIFIDFNSNPFNIFFPSNWLSLIVDFQRIWSIFYDLVIEINKDRYSSFPSTCSSSLSNVRHCNFYFLIFLQHLFSCLKKNEVVGFDNECSFL